MYVSNLPVERLAELTPLSGITTSISIILFGPAIGRWIDRSTSRLKTLLTTISINRFAIITACICWFILLTGQDGSADTHSPARKQFTTAHPPAPNDPHLTDVKQVQSIASTKNVTFIIILFLGVLERLSRTANLLSMERDWVPTLVPPLSGNKGTTELGLAQVNAAMSRIDLVCKLVSPILISAFISVIGPVTLGVVAIALTNTLSWGIEHWSARKVWKSSTRLKKPKDSVPAVNEYIPLTEIDSRSASLESFAPVILPQPSKTSGITTFFRTFLNQLSALGSDWVHGLRCYIASDVWMPSLALCILHVSVLVFTATMTVHLLNAGFPLTLITVAQALSAIFELSSTFITPWVISKLSASFATARYAVEESTGVVAGTLLSGNAQREDDSRTTGSVAAVSKVGIWALSEMFLSLVGII
jgi:solute carrier family 40 (iron-regulated transporter), member 1